MEVQSILLVAEEGCKGSIDHMKKEFGGLQIGRASGSLVEGLMVDMYGSAQPMKAVASISVPEARSIQIQPWDKAALGPIEKAIRDSTLNLNPINDGVCVRINIPMMTEDRRKDLVKIVKKMAEDAKIAVRNFRHDAQNGYKNAKNNSEITEDDLKTYEKVLQEKVDKYNKEIDELSKSKETDIMTV